MTPAELFGLDTYQLRRLGPALAAVDLECEANLKTIRARAMAERIHLGVLIDLASLYPQVAREFVRLVDVSAVEGFERRRLFEEIPRALVAGEIKSLEEDLVEANALRGGGLVDRGDLRRAINDALDMKAAALG